MIAAESNLDLEVEIEPLFNVLDWASIGAMPSAKPGLALNNYQHGFRAAAVKFPAETLELEVVESSTSFRKFRGWWVPMGHSRQAGPAFGEFDQCLPLKASDGRSGGAGVAAHGMLRTLV